MSLLLIILLILAGLVLLLLEIFVIPGITIAGIAGVIFLILGIIFAYVYHGSVTGHLTIAGTLVMAGFLLYLAFRQRTWNRLALHTSIDSKIETVEVEKIKPGDTGVTVSRLNPVGKAKINDDLIEAHCPGKFIDEGTSVEVVKVFNTHVVVKPVS